jgi:signal transduction histidine kinase
MEDVNCLHQEGNFDLVLMKPENMILSNNVTILEDGAGRFSGHVISSRNITDVRERENARMEFVNLLAVQILEKINPLPTREEFDIQLRLKLDEIRAMIQKFTYFTDLISGPLRLNRFRHTLGEVIFSSIKQVQFKLDHAQVKVNVALENEKLEIEVDEEKLSESLCIVLNNAIKCTPAGGTIRIKGFYKEDMVRVIVADQGPGITPDVLQTVFDSETLQKKVSEDGEFSIGLLYVRHVVDAHGGSVEIASEIGVGTEVKLSVPIMLH